MKYIPTHLAHLRHATEDDFRTIEGTFKLHLEYYEYMLGVKVWEQNVTCETTDRDWLKAKIAFKNILINETPILWNQNKVKIQQLHQQLLNAL